MRRGRVTAIAPRPNAVARGSEWEDTAQQAHEGDGSGRMGEAARTNDKECLETERWHMTSVDNAGVRTEIDQLQVLERELCTRRHASIALAPRPRYLEGCRGRRFITEIMRSWSEAEGAAVEKLAGSSTARSQPSRGTRLARWRPWPHALHELHPHPQRTSKGGDEAVVRDAIARKDEGATARCVTMHVDGTEETLEAAILAAPRECEGSVVQRQPVRWLEPTIAACAKTRV